LTIVTPRFRVAHDGGPARTSSTPLLTPGFLAETPETTGGTAVENPLDARARAGHDTDIGHRPRPHADEERIDFDRRLAHLERTLDGVVDAVRSLLDGEEQDEEVAEIRRLLDEAVDRRAAAR
jgi:hypothetical protein